MKLSKIIILILIILLSAQVTFAEENRSSVKSTIDLLDGLSPDSAVNMDGTDGYTIFDENSTEVVHTKGRKFWPSLKFGRKKKKVNDDKPIVIDYDYNTETEEIIPVVNEVNKDNKKEIKKDEPVKNKKAEKVKKKKSGNDEISGTDVNIYCDDMVYDDEKKEIIGTGNAKVVFPENNVYMTAKKIVYNHDLNYFEGIDDVKIVRNGVTMEGDYTKVDLNYGNAFIDKPIIDNYMVKVVAKSGMATTDTLEAYEGTANIKENYEQRVSSSQYVSFFQMDVNDKLLKKFYPKEYRNKTTKYHIKTKELNIDSTNGHDTVKFKNADIYLGKVLLLKGADLKLSTDKTQSFVETTLPEIGSMRYVGAYAGPGFVFNTPGSSTLKLAPIISLDGGNIGLGILARFRHSKNLTQVIYSSAANEFVAKGRQKFGDSDFTLEYTHLSYANDWFFGSGISKNLIQLAYQKRYIFPEVDMTFAHRGTAGYLTDEFGNKGTSRFRYMAMLTKGLAVYENYDRKIFARLDLITQGMMGVYGTGDSTGVFRIGPSLRTQYRGWSQQISYFQSAKGGASPLIYTDDYRYGASNIQFVESLRLNKYLSLSYFASLNLNDSDPTVKNMFSESRVSISVGPPEAKLSLSYDMIRQGARLNYTALIGTKNQDVSFKKLFIKNPKNIGKSDEKDKPKKKWFFQDRSDELVQSTDYKQPVNAEDNSVVEDKDFESTMESPAIFAF